MKNHEVRQYAEEYFRDIDIYLRDSARRKHLPILLATICQHQDKDVIRFLGLSRLPGTE